MCVFICYSGHEIVFLTLLKTQHTQLKTQHTKLKTQHTQLKTQNTKLKTHIKNMQYKH